jgi:hypothetical protein
MAAAQEVGTAREAAGDDEKTARKIAACDANLAQYRAALDAGASPATIAAWIRRDRSRTGDVRTRNASVCGTPRMSEAEIRAIVHKLADIAGVLQDADPDDKAAIFRQLGLKLTYHQGRQLVEARIDAPQHWYSDWRAHLP